MKKEIYNAEEMTSRTIKDVGLSILFPPYAIIKAIPEAMYNLSQVKNGIEVNELNDRLRMMTEAYLDVRKVLGYPDKWGHYKKGNFVCKCSKSSFSIYKCRIEFIIDGDTFSTATNWMMIDEFERKYYDLVWDIVFHEADDDRLLSKNRDEFMDYFNDVYYPWLTETATSLLNSGADRSRWF